MIVTGKYDANVFMNPSEAYPFACCSCKMISFYTLVHKPCGKFYCSACMNTPLCDLCGEIMTDNLVSLGKWNPDMNKTLRKLQVSCQKLGLSCGSCGWKDEFQYLKDHLVDNHGCIYNTPPSIDKDEDSVKIEGKGLDQSHCKYLEAGCTFIGSTADLKDHEQTSTEHHLNLVWNYALQLKDRNQNLTPANPAAAPVKEIYTSSYNSMPEAVAECPVEREEYNPRGVMRERRGFRGRMPMRRRMRGRPEFAERGFRGRRGFRGGFIVLQKSIG